MRRGTDQEVAEAVHRLSAHAENTRDALRELMRLVGSSSELDMSLSKLAAADEALGRLVRLELKKMKVSRG